MVLSLYTCTCTKYTLHVTYIYSSLLAQAGKILLILLHTDTGISTGKS